MTPAPENTADTAAWEAQRTDSPAGAVVGQPAPAGHQQGAVQVWHVDSAPGITDLPPIPYPWPQACICGRPAVGLWHVIGHAWQPSCQLGLDAVGSVDGTSLATPAVVQPDGTWRYRPGYGWVRS